jgi:hypothetical protein
LEVALLRSLLMLLAAWLAGRFNETELTELRLM